MALRAFAVTTKFTHEGLGIAPLAVMISTVWPLRSTVRSGVRRRSTLAATQRLPMSVWTAYAKSTTVAPLGSRRISPLGVNTYTLSGNRSTFTLSRNSSDEPLSCSETRFESHSRVCCCWRDSPAPPALYFQCEIGRAHV